MNNLRQIGLALHNHESAWKRFPAQATYGQQGQPLLSWRYQILPQMEELRRYDRFRRDEAWDSPNNKPLLSPMPEGYRAPDQQPDEMDKTRYLAAVGSEAPGRRTVFFGKTLTSMDYISAKDGCTNTILAVEALPERAVPWSKPEDLPFDPKDPKAGLVDGRRRQFNAVFADGHINTFSANIDPEVLRRLFFMNDGEPVTEADLRAAQGGR